MRRFSLGRHLKLTRLAAAGPLPIADHHICRSGRSQRCRRYRRYQVGIVRLFYASIRLWWTVWINRIANRAMAVAAGRNSG